MAQSKLEIIIDLAADEAVKKSKDLEKGLDGVTKSTERTTKGMDGFGSMLSKVVTGAVLLQLGRQLIDFSKASVSAAANIEETMSKFNVVFRDSADSVMEELGKFAQAAGRSQYELAGFAANLQDTFVPLGFAREEAAKLSVNMVKLAEDLASFNNLNTADVVRDLQSALVGNTMVLRKYGVVAQETQIQQKALEMGLWSGKGAIDASAKAQTILQLTIEGTADAQGDALRTADSYTNRQKALEAATLDLQKAIGDGLIPSLTLWTDIKIALLEATTNLILASAQVTQSIKDERQAAMDAGLTFDEYIGTLGELNYRTRNYLETQRAAYDAGVEAAQQMRYNTEMVEKYVGAHAQLERAMVPTIDIIRKMGLGAEATGTKMDALEATGSVFDRIGKSAEGAQTKVKGFFDGLNTSLSSQLESNISNLEYALAGGFDMSLTSKAIQDALDTGAISPAQARTYFEQLYVEEQKLQLALNNITAREAAANISSTLGISIQNAREELKGVVSTFDILSNLETHTTLVIDVVVNDPTGALSFIPTQLYGSATYLQGLRDAAREDYLRDLRRGVNDGTAKIPE
jgi:hypothetical protein